MNKSSITLIKSIKFLICLEFSLIQENKLLYNYILLINIYNYIFPELH